MLAAFATATTGLAPAPLSSRQCRAPSLIMSTGFDVNAAMTRLNAAVAREDYAAAAAIKAEIDAARDGGDAASAAAPALSWAPHTPPWLYSRLEDLGFRYPTPVQAGALAAARGEQRDVVLSAPTGAGKTLAFMVPLLCEAAGELERRGEQSVAAVSALLDSPLVALSATDAMNALSPQLELPGGGGALGGGLGGGVPLPARGPPLGLVVAPTPALVEQAARVCYALVGGYTRESRTYVPGARDSLFRYEGPRAARIAALCSAADAAAAVAAGGGPLVECDVLVATPAALAAARGALDASALRVACVDEADACDGAGSLAPLPARVRRALVGATVEGAAVTAAVGAGWLAPPALVDGGGGVRAWSDAGGTQAQALCAPGLAHRVAVAGGGTVAGGGGGVGGGGVAPLLALARLLRADLRAWEAAAAAAAGGAAPRPRAVVFVADGAAALRVGAALRGALWGEQAVATRAGDAPEVGAAAFRSERGISRQSSRAAGFGEVIGAGGASVLVTPAAEARGLDFPEVSHVYLHCVALGRGAAGAAEYAHLAGRAGRVGQAARGVVTSVLAAEADADALAAIVRGALGQSLEAVPVPTAADEEDERRALDDLLALGTLDGDG